MKKKFKKNPTISKLKKKLDAIYSKWLRLSYASKNGYCECISCGKKFHWKEGDCGHYISRNHNATRYYFRNTYPQCKRCNIMLGGNYPEFTHRLIGRFGVEIIEELVAMKRITKQFKPYELEELIDEFKGKVKELEVER